MSTLLLLAALALLVLGGRAGSARVFVAGLVLLVAASLSDVVRIAETPFSTLSATLKSPAAASGEVSPQ